MRLKNTGRAVPLVREVLSLAATSQMPIGDIQRKSGVSLNTMYGWTAGRSPGIHLVIAVAGALGYELKLVRVEDGKK